MYEYKIVLDENGLNNLMKVKEIFLDKNFEKLDNPDKIKELMINEYQFDKLAEEHLFLIALNQSTKPLGIFEVSHGTATSTLVINRDIFIKLCLCGATGFILIHNHPSGDCNPSENDFSATKLVKNASELMNIPIIDHIIIGNNYYSFREKGFL